MKVLELGTYEVFRNFLGANIEKQAKRKRNIKVDAKNIGFDCGAKANRRLEVGQALDEAAARSFWWSPNGEAN